MNIVIDHDLETTIVRLEGDFISESDRLALQEQVRNLIAQGRIHLIVDLTGVPYINSSGLGALVAGLISARRADGDLQLACVGPEVEKTIRITRLDSVFNIYPTVPGSTHSGQRP